MLSCTLFLSCKGNIEKEPSEIIPQLTAAEMSEDFAVFQSIFEQANAGLYKYRTKSEMDKVFNSQKEKISDTTSYREFYNIIWKVIDFSGSSHNSLSYPSSVDAGLSTKEIFFPLPLKYIEGKLINNLPEAQIPIGAEILRINGIESPEFAKITSAYVSTDGYNTSGKYANLDSDWLPFYVYLAVGPQDEFEIEYKTPGTDPITETLPAINYDTFYSNYGNRHSKSFEENMEGISFNISDDAEYAILKVATFRIGGPESEIHKKYANFLESSFSELKEKNIKNLIVDIRGNGGGDDPNDLLLYSYLTQRDFKENTSAFTLFNKIPFSHYYADDDIEELEEELKEEHSELRDGRYYQSDLFNPVWHPKENAYQGNLVLLINPFVASAGSLFGSMVKSDKKAVVIGEETLGGYYGHTGHIAVSYILPNSEFKLTFSIVDLEQDVRTLEDQKKGLGIKPDYTVHQSYKDFLNNRDTQLEFAKDLIQKKKI